MENRWFIDGILIGLLLLTNFRPVIWKVIVSIVIPLFVIFRNFSSASFSWDTGFFRFLLIFSFLFK